jgi:hypothetical protein
MTVSFSVRTPVCGVRDWSRRQEQSGGGVAAVVRMRADRRVLQDLEEN